MLKLLKLIFAFTVVLSTLACSELQDELEVFKDDVDFDANDRTMDIRLIRAEPTALDVIQSAYLAHLYLPAFDFLDLSDMPDNAVLVGETYRADCEVSGFATYEFSMTAVEHYQKGDRFQVSYQDCLNSEGLTYNGAAIWKYTDIDGLNNRFGLIDSQTCVDRLDGKIDGGYRLFENRDEEGEYYPADAIRFIQVEDYLELQYLRLVDSESDNDDLSDSDYAVIDTQRTGSSAVVVLRSVVEDLDRIGEGEVRYKLSDEGFPSMGGDEIYLVKGVNWTRQNCQSYVRHANLRLDQLEVELPDSSAYRLGASLKVYESSDDFSSYEYKIKNDDFDVFWTRGAVQSKFSYADFQVSTRLSANSTAHSFRMSGALEHPDYGMAFVSTDEPILSRGIGVSPYDGSITILGRADEGIFVGIFAEELRLGIDIDGDNNGDGVPDNDFGIVTYWQDLIDMRFQEVP